MHNTLVNVDVLAGGGLAYDLMKKLSPHKIFDDLVLDFLEELSRTLLSKSETRMYSDIVAFAFFCRSANLYNLKEKYRKFLENSLGWGLAFHIAPSNVPINFAYSLVVGLLSGNACVVKVSSKPFIQTEIICRVINQIVKSPKYQDLGNYISIIRYQNDSYNNQFFSGLADIRLIWGGDETIANIRNAKIPPRSFEVTFADRFSFCIIDAQRYLEIDNKEKVALNFYNDTYFFDQNACTSPKLIFWFGDSESISNAKKIFWEIQHKLLVKKNYLISSSGSIQKLNTSYRASIDFDGAFIITTEGNLISRIEVDDLPLNLGNYQCTQGVFFEYSGETLDPLLRAITRKYQTLTYIGFESSELISQLVGARVQGVDRVVPCGRAAEFSLEWDGYDLILKLSRRIFSA